MRKFQELIASHEDWLVARTLQYAKQHGYTRYSSTLLEAWRQSVVGLSAALTGAIDDPTYQPEIDADADYTSDPMTAFGVDQARRHRSRGIDLTMFLALLKYYRQSYLDLIAEHVADVKAFRSYYDFALKMFDKIELGCNSEWQKVSFAAELDAVQHQNKELTEQKLIYLTIFETLKDPVIFADDSGRIRNMNRSACLSFTQYGTPGAIYYGKTDIGETERLFKPFFDFPSTEADFPDCHLPTSTGTRRFHIKARRMIDSSERMAGVVLICTDITDFQQALQDAAQADRAKSAFLATMSHELRTPAAGILGASELLGHTRLAEPQRHHLDLIEASASTLLGILDEVLDYSKFEEIGVVASTEDFDFGDAIGNIVKIMRHQAARKAVALDVSVAPEVPRRLNGDSRKLNRVLINLIGNAVKFTDRGSIALSVGTGARRPDGSLVLEFSVADTGIGFAPEKIEQLFKPFTQGDDTISRKFGGTGLGLAICKRIVDTLGGEIGAESRGAAGSTFWFRLPFREARSPRMAAEAPTAAPSEALAVLMVEDNDVNRIVGAGLLEHIGHKVDVAGDGDSALAMLNGKDYDIVLLDLHLPGMNGYEIAEAIRALGDPRKARTPIVVLTADDSAMARKEAAAANLDGFLLKPLRSDELRRVLADARRSRPRPEPGPASLIEEDILRGHARELGADTALHIASVFRSSSATIAQEIAEALECGQTARIARNAHKIKGGALNLGLTLLARSAAELERKVPSAAPESLGPDIDAFLDCLHASLAALEDFIKRAL